VKSTLVILTSSEFWIFEKFWHFSGEKFPKIKFKASIIVNTAIFTFSIQLKLVSPFTWNQSSRKIGRFPHSDFHIHSVENMKFSLTEKKFVKSTSLVKNLVSQNYCQKNLRENFCIFSCLRDICFFRNWPKIEFEQFSFLYFRFTTIA